MLASIGLLGRSSIGWRWRMSGICRGSLTLQSTLNLRSLWNGNPRRCRRGRNSSGQFDHRGMSGTAARLGMSHIETGTVDSWGCSRHRSSRYCTCSYAAQFDRQGMWCIQWRYRLHTRNHTQCNWVGHPGKYGPCSRTLDLLWQCRCRNYTYRGRCMFGTCWDMRYSLYSPRHRRSHPSTCIAHQSYHLCTLGTLSWCIPGIGRNMVSTQRHHSSLRGMCITLPHGFLCRQYISWRRSSPGTDTHNLGMTMWSATFTSHFALVLT
jgi:hypothetical protein